MLLLTLVYVQALNVILLQCRQQNDMVGQLLSQWFCFIQTDDGKVVAVQHASDEKQSAVDLKKSIAAAFQANFRGTKDEKESDPQSEHIAHYRYAHTAFIFN